MPRKKLSQDEKKEILTIWIEGKYLKNQNKEQLREIAYNAILTHLNNENKK